MDPEYYQGSRLHKCDQRGWIVDLRENTGGNMYPMIAGLGPIIGEGTLGYFYNAKGKQQYGWRYAHGAIGRIKLKHPYVLKQSHQKIAVLIGSRTASSGEMTAISFMGQPNVRLFGQASGGYTTGNAVFPLKDGTALVLASSYVADRHKNKYTGRLNPDVTVETGSDIIEACSPWLLEK